MDASPDTRLAEQLARHVAGGSSASAIADEIVAIWREIDRSLTPIIAAQGCALLYQRSLHRTSASFPWLSEAYTSAQSPMDLPALHSALVRQDPATVAAAGHASLSGFRLQLAGLIGASLTEFLLRSAWTHPHRDTPAQDLTQ